MMRRPIIGIAAAVVFSLAVWLLLACVVSAASGREQQMLARAGEHFGTGGHSRTAGSIYITRRREGADQTSRSTPTALH